MDSTSIYRKTEAYVRNLYLQSNPKLPYHNLDHTIYVVKKASEIAAHFELSEDEMLSLFLAAWFHDTGYLNGEAEGHEERSAAFFKTFALENEVPEDVANAAIQNIMATRRNLEPLSLTEKILADADTFHFGTKDFEQSDKLVYQEWQAMHPEKNRADFLKGTQDMLSRHVYYTTYANEKLNKRKKRNLKELKKRAEQKNEPVTDQTVKPWVLNDDSGAITEITEKAGTTKGMQTMLRVTSANHIQLSEMADSKANILISVNAIIISVILSVLLRKLQTDPYLTIPTLIFLVFAVVTIVLSILATRPKVNDGTFAEEDILNKNTNLLFFGNFHKMNLPEYESAMRTMMRDSDYLYSSMIKDIYFLGKVLGKKYQLIRWAYTIFMIGIVLSVIAFAMFTILYSPTDAPSAGGVSTGSPF